MMHVKRTFALATIAAAIFVTALPAQEGGLTIEKAVEIANSHNPEVLAARTAIEAARGRTLQFKVRPEPQILASLEGLPIPGLKKEGDQTEINLGIEQVFEYPGKRSLRKEIGLQGEALAQAELERVQLLVAARVKKAYWKAAFAGSAAEALRRSESRLDALLTDLQVKYRTSAASYADILRARAEKARLRNKIIEQTKERNAAGLELNVLLGRASDEPIQLLTGMSFTPLTADLPSLWENARTTRTSFLIAALLKDRAATAVKLAGLSRRPDFLAGFLFPSVRPNAWGISFGLTMPFLRPGKAKGLAMEASAEAEFARIAAEALDRRVRSVLERAYAAAKAAEEQVLVFEKSLLSELESEIRIQLEYFRYGKVEAFSLLDLHRTYVMAEVEHLHALLSYNLALVDLEVAGEEME
jgi:cobalt-zinc-cadmium efflux system outer membrane protein